MLCYQGSHFWRHLQLRLNRHTIVDVDARSSLVAPTAAHDCLAERLVVQEVTGCAPAAQRIWAVIDVLDFEESRCLVEECPELLGIAAQ